MTDTAKTPPAAADAKKPDELIRFGLSSKPMPLTKLAALIEIAEAPEGSTIRVYNGSAIIEGPAPAADAPPK